MCRLHLLCKCILKEFCCDSTHPCTATHIILFIRSSILLPIFGFLISRQIIILRKIITFFLDKFKTSTNYNLLWLHHHSSSVGQCGMSKRNDIDQKRTKLKISTYTKVPGQKCNIIVLMVRFIFLGSL